MQLGGPWLCVTKLSRNRTSRQDLGAAELCSLRRAWQQGPGPWAPSFCTRCSGIEKQMGVRGGGREGKGPGWQATRADGPGAGRCGSALLFSQVPPRRRPRTLRPGAQCEAAPEEGRGPRQSKEPELSSQPVVLACCLSLTRPEQLGALASPHPVYHMGG